MDPVINFAKAGTETCNSGKKGVVGDEGGICTLKDVSYSVFLILPELPRGWAGRGGVAIGPSPKTIPQTFLLLNTNRLPFNGFLADFYISIHLASAFSN